MDIRADLHIHTVLSPCGDLEMSPENILHFAQVQGLNMIGITDHNSTRQAPIIRDYGKTKGIFVLTGAEICSKEEVHALSGFLVSCCCSCLAGLSSCFVAAAAGQCAHGQCCNCNQSNHFLFHNTSPPKSFDKKF